MGKCYFGCFANYERTFANIHSISAMIGMTAEQETSKKVVGCTQHGAHVSGLRFNGLKCVDYRRQ